MSRMISLLGTQDKPQCSYYIHVKNTICRHVQVQQLQTRSEISGVEIDISYRNRVLANITCLFDMREEIPR